MAITVDFVSHVSCFLPFSLLVTFVAWFFASMASRARNKLCIVFTRRECVLRIEFCSIVHSDSLIGAILYLRFWFNVSFRVTGAVTVYILVSLLSGLGLG